MCIIAYIKPNQQITDQTIRIMFRGNSDGAGIMYQQSRKHNPRIIKGFMNVEELIKAFRSIPEHFERAIHCRIATAGKVSVQCCHPFPVRDMADRGLLRRVYCGAKGKRCAGYAEDSVRAFLTGKEIAR